MPRKSTKEPLKTSYSNDYNYEIGIDEVGRGPMFGRVYTAAVILPKNDSFDHSQMKDSKRFSSKKKINEVAEYIKKNAIAYAVSYESEDVIDKINILQATHSSMHKAVKEILDKNISQEKVLLLVDGNNFKPYMCYDKEKGLYSQVNHKCIEGGDNKYTAIAAASILAKVERDKYIEELCSEYPHLDERYDLLSNKGYGTKAHMDGIKKHGITAWHRRTYGICKNYSVSLDK
tara:strand:- start:1427 stop:2122 length:696 start_codon:yes stop_codon:yes gene_type:complete